MNPFQLRPVMIDDVVNLQKISCSTFKQTFAEHNTEEDLNKYLAEQLSIQKLSDEINNPCSAFYFAIDHEQIIGYIKLNWGNAQTEMIDPNAFEIERIYILNTYFGKGVGQYLLDEAITLGKKRNPSYIWLGVWEHNQRAIRFYEKNGFVIFDSHIFKLGNDSQKDFLMKRI